MFSEREGLNIISNIAAFLLMSLLLVYVLVTKKKIVINIYLICQVMFIVACLVSSLYAINYSTVLGKVITLLLIFLLTFLIINYVDTFEKIEKILSYVMYAGIIASIYIIVNADFTQIQRFGGELGNQNIVGLNIAFSSIICFNQILYKKKYWNIIFLLVMTVCILLTGSRKALLVLIMSILMIAFLKNRYNMKQLIKFAIISIVILILFYFLTFEIPMFYRIIGRRLENLFNFFTVKGTSEGSMNTRYDMIKRGIEFIKEKPILGYGIDNYRYLYGNTYSHNNIIELMVGTGIVGFSIFYFMQLIVIKDLIKKSKNIVSKDVNYVFATILLSYIVMSLAFIYYYDKIFYIFIAVASTVDIINKRDASSAEKTSVI